MYREINLIQLFLFDWITAADGRIECNALLCQQTNECVEYFKHLVCSIFFNRNYHLADTIHMIRHFLHSMTNRFAHSTTNYRYQFKFLQCHTLPMLLPSLELREMSLPPYRVVYHPLQPDFAPYLLFPLGPTEEKSCRNGS